jgi:hypothetical protein
VNSVQKHNKKLRTSGKNRVRNKNLFFVLIPFNLRRFERRCDVTFNLCLLRTANKTTHAFTSLFLFFHWISGRIYRILNIQMRCSSSRRFSYHRLSSSFTPLVARIFFFLSRFYQSFLSDCIVWIYLSFRLSVFSFVQPHALANSHVSVCVFRLPFFLLLKKSKTEPTSSLSPFVHRKSCRMFRRAKHQQPLAYISVASGPSLSGRVKVASSRDSFFFLLSILQEFLS